MVFKPVDEIQPLSLRANFSWSFVGNVIYAVSQWATIIVLARLGTPEMVGQFALGLAITAPIIQLTNLSLRQIQATDASNQYSFRDYFSLRLLMILLAMVIITLIATVAYQGETRWIIIWIGVAKSFESMSDIIYGLLQQKERMDRIAQVQIIKAPTTLIAISIGIIISGRLIGGILGMCIVWFLLMYGYDLRNARQLLDNDEELIPYWNRYNLKNLIWLSLPLGIVMLLISLGVSIPRIYIEQYLGEGQLGIFVAIAYLLVAGGTIVAALGQSASPRLAKYIASQNRADYVRLILFLMGIGLSIGLIGLIGALFFGEWLLTLVYGADYGAQASVFVLLMVSGTIMYLDSFAGYAITAARVFKLQIPLVGIPTFITYILCIIFLPQGTLYTAVWILIVVSIISLLGKVATILWIFATKFGKPDKQVVLE